MHFLSVIVGLLALGVVLLDAFETVILPRRATGKLRLTRLFYVTTWSAWCALAGKVRGARQRETAFSFFGPLSLLLLIVTWAFGLMLGFALLYLSLGVPFTDPLGVHGFRTAIYVSGTTLFTLGLGDVVPHNPAARELIVVEAGMGLGFVALVIGYLPVLYGAFSRREVTIALLDGRAGSPPTAAELLRRHAFPGGMDILISLLAEWERWSAELLESHISYPLLCYFRSQHDNQSWLSALTAILDSSALLMSVVDAGCARQAQLTFAMARHASVDLLLVFGLEPLALEGPEVHSRDHRGGHDRLSTNQFTELTGMLAAAGVRLRTDATAQEQLAELRGLYEGQVAALGRYLAMPLPPFFSAEPKRDTWMKVANLRGTNGPEYRSVAGRDNGAILAEQAYHDEAHPF